MIASRSQTQTRSGQAIVACERGSAGRARSAGAAREANRFCQVDTFGDDPLVAGVGVVARHRRDRPHRSDERHVDGRLSAHGGDLVADPVPPRCSERSGPKASQAATPSAIGACATAAAMRRSSAAIVTTCPPAERRPPDRHPLWVDTVELPGERDRRPPVVELAADVDQLPWLPRRGAEVAVVEDHRAHAGRRETLGIGRQPRLARPAEPVRHHDAGRRSVALPARKARPRSAPRPR